MKMFRNVVPTYVLEHFSLLLPRGGDQRQTPVRPSVLEPQDLVGITKTVFSPSTRAKDERRRFHSHLLVWGIHEDCSLGPSHQQEQRDPQKLEVSLPTRSCGPRRIGI